MKKSLKHILLYPFSIVYGLITGFRNWLFNQGILKSTSFNFPIISVGNLAVGGTGKTPHTEFILSIFKDELSTAVLSRGYKRTTKGFYLANNQSTSKTIGDEPYQIFRKFPEITVAVDEKRVHGIKKLMELNPGLKLAILDDAYQHRYIQAGFSILLTDYSNLYTRDILLPAGTLREWKSGSKRANMIIVTKCPADFKPIDMRVIESELKPQTNQNVFFSRYIYDELKPVFPDSEPEDRSFENIKETNASVLLVCGIVTPKAIVDYLEKFSDSVTTLFYPDHYAFQAKDMAIVKSRFEKINSPLKVLIVTEKDAARLVSNPDFPESLKSKTYSLPIRVEILHNQKNLLIQKIKNYVVENSRNR